MKHEDFEQITRSKTRLATLINAGQLHETALELFTMVEPNKKIRLMGLSISNLEDQSNGQSLQIKPDFR